MDAASISVVRRGPNARYERLTVTTFKDHFSVARGYGRYRPGYPDALFDFLAAAAPGHRLALDCGTGSGQAARGLEGRFDRVAATDPSLRQLGRARRARRGQSPLFFAARAESAPLADLSVDLVTVGQALHWFDLDVFYAEVRRVVRPGGVVAAWSYALFRAGNDVDRVVDALHDGTVEAFWPPERRFVDGRYADLPFPFERLATPRLDMTASWDLDEVMGYLDTWSAVHRYRRETGADPLPAVRRELAPMWGGKRTVRFPLTVLAGRVAF